jgi:hypothetical protein
MTKTRRRKTTMHLSTRNFSLTDLLDRKLGLAIDLE